MLLLLQQHISLSQMVTLIRSCVFLNRVIQSVQVKNQVLNSHAQIFIFVNINKPTGQHLDVVFPNQGLISNTDSRPTLNYRKAKNRVKVWRQSQTIGLGCKSPYEINHWVPQDLIVILIIMSDLGRIPVKFICLSWFCILIAQPLSIITNRSLYIILSPSIYLNQITNNYGYKY